MPNIAIIGAGMAGLSCVNGLVGHGVAQADIKLFEKSRGIGGRMATRYAGAFEFDHGAQYFTIGAERFGTAMAPFVEAGTIAKWPTRIETIGGASARAAERFVAAPRMNTLCKEMAAGFDIALQVRIADLRATGSGWELVDETGASLGVFDYVISAMPAPQLRALMPSAFAEYTQDLDRVLMAGCFSLMLGFETTIDLPWEAARIEGSPVGWMCVNSGKPGRETGASVLIQSSNDWAEAHLEDDRGAVERALLEAATELCGVDLSGAVHKALHRWLYASTPQPLGQPFLLDAGQGLGACGDWCLGGRVEAAFESGAALGEALAAELS